MGFTHVLTMDSDGQHPPEKIPEFMAASMSDANALVLGVPIFDASAPALRVRGRKVSNWWANLETLWQGIGDSLYGFRVYPAHLLMGVMEQSYWMRHFDFDPEAAVRLCWCGARPINIPAPVKYFAANEGGVSHFNYLRDNLLLTGMVIPRTLFDWRFPGRASARQAHRQFQLSGFRFRRADSGRGLCRAGFGLGQPF